MIQAAKRQYELKDPVQLDDLAAACAVLKKHSMMLLTASKAYVRHPELAAAKANRDYVLNRLDLSSKGSNESTVIFNLMYILLLHYNPRFVMQ